MSNLSADDEASGFSFSMRVSWMLKHEGGLFSEEEIAKLDAMDLRYGEPQL
jgi:hypothetical protein